MGWGVLQLLSLLQSMLQSMFFWAEVCLADQIGGRQLGLRYEVEAVLLKNT